MSDDSFVVTSHCSFGLWPDSVQTEVIVTDPSPVAHLRVLETRLIPKPNHVVPNANEMRALLELPAPTPLLLHTREDEQEDDQELPPALLHSSVLDSLSSRLYLDLKGIVPCDTRSDSDSASKAVLSASKPYDHVEHCTRLSWFSTVIELTRKPNETMRTLMKRHMQILAGKSSFVCRL